MSYASDVISCLNAELPDCDPHLIVLYALLVLVRGDAVTNADVHDAWALWTVAYRGAVHDSLVPYDLLQPGVQALDEPFRDAIARVCQR